jgi:hypothetical protein
VKRTMSFCKRLFVTLLEKGKPSKAMATGLIQPYFPQTAERF